jgi:hypothetical protein
MARSYIHSILRYFKDICIAWEDVMGEKWNSKEGWALQRSNHAYFYTHDQADIKYDIP